MLEFLPLLLPQCVFVDNALLIMFSDPYQPARRDGTLSSLLSLLNDKKACNVAKRRMYSINRI